jgi:hypothetical protein
MGLLGMADPSFVSADALTGLAFGIIKLLGYGALGIVAFGLLLSGLCDLFECRKLRRDQGRSELWQLIH